MKRIIRSFRVVSVAAMLPMFCVGTASAIDLGDLRISSARLAKKTGGEVGWYEPADLGYVFERNGRQYPADLNTWTEYNATNSAHMSILGCSTMTPNDGGADHAALACAIRSTSGDPDGKIIYIPQGVYEIQNRVFSLDENDNTLVRGDGMGATVLRASFDTGSLKSSGDFPECRGRTVLQFCPGGTASDSFAKSSWTAGFDANGTVVTVSDPSLFSVGGWMLLKGRPANSDPEWGFEKGKGGNWTFEMLVKILGRNGSQLTIDRPLTIDLNGGKDRWAYEMSNAGKQGVAERFGLEDLSITNPNHQTDGGTTLTKVLSLSRCSQCWVRGVRFSDGYSGFVAIGESRMVLFEGNEFDDLWYTKARYGSAVYIRGTYDSIFENNWHTGTIHRLFTLENGPARNVIAYNYGPPNTNGNVHERFIFLHGDNPAVNLSEGNEVRQGRIETDRFWGRSGEFNTFYRNRVSAPNYCFNADDHTLASGARTCTSDASCASSQYCAPYSRDGIVTESNSTNPLPGARNSIDNNYILNASSSFHDWYSCKKDGTRKSAQDCNNFDDNRSTTSIPYGLESFWFESNLARNINIDSDDGDPNSDCGDGTGKAGCADLGTNTQGNTLSCSGKTYPSSLYRDAAPEWWCEEACDWNALSGIGACGDNISPANVDATSNLCKLPAQILAAGGTCTRIAGGGPPPPLPAPLAAPFLLP